MPRGRDEPRLDAAQLAHGPRLRALLRLLGAQTNQWYPDLVYDSHPVDPPRSPEEGYHLTEDLTEAALEFIQDAKAVAPEKPFFLYYAPGACHTPTTRGDPWPFVGGTIHRVAVDVSGDPYVDLEREAAAMLARE